MRCVFTKCGVLYFSLPPYDLNHARVVFQRAIKKTGFPATAAETQRFMRGEDVVRWGRHYRLEGVRPVQEELHLC